MKTCAFCAKEFSGRGYILRDKDGRKFGLYCSKVCAEHDAWGPRLRPHTIQLERKSRAKKAV